jgi:GNAT superfamily N-acetyltransferase
MKSRYIKKAARKLQGQDDIVLEGLVRLGKNDERPAAKMLAVAFANDPMFEYMMPEPETRRKVMAITYRSIIRMYMANGRIYATSKNLEGVLCVHLPGKRRFKLAVLTAGAGSLLLPFRLMRHLSLPAVIKRARGISSATTEMRKFINDCGEHIYVDMVAVDGKYRGQKYMSMMMRAVLTAADRLGVRCVLETESEPNVQIYRHFGFSLAHTIEAVPGRLMYYIMVYEPNGRKGMASAIQA